MYAVDAGVIQARCGQTGRWWKNALCDVRGVPPHPLHPGRSIGRVPVGLQVSNPNVDAGGEHDGGCLAAQSVKTPDPAPALLQKADGDHVIAEQQKTLPEKTRVSCSPLNGRHGHSKLQHIDVLGMSPALADGKLPALIHDERVWKRRYSLRPVHVATVSQTCIDRHRANFAPRRSLRESKRSAKYGCCAGRISRKEMSFVVRFGAFQTSQR